MFFEQGNKGKNNLALYIVTTFLILIAYSIGQSPLFFVVKSKLQKGNYNIDIAEFFENPDFESIGMSNNFGLFLLLIMFVTSFIALSIGVKYLHQKSMINLVSADNRIDWRRVIFGFAVWMILLAIGDLVLYLTDPAVYQYNFNPKKIIGLLAICIFILPIQTSFEELFFRGYLLQGFYNVINNKWIVIILTSFLFMLVHSTNPEIKQYGLGIMLCYYFLAGLLLGLVTMFDNRLELALGMHAGMNMYGAIFVGYEGGAIQTDSVLKMSDINAPMMVLTLIVAGLVFIFLAKRNFNWSLSVENEVPIA